MNQSRVRCGALRGGGFLAVLVLCGLFNSTASGDGAGSAVKTARDEQSLRDILPELMKGHNDKIELADYATSILRRLDPPVKDFCNHMYDDEKELSATLKAWAHKNHYELKFHFGDDLQGKARKEMEDTQGKRIEGDGNEAFQRDVLMFMDTDYQWQRSLVVALQKVATDPELKAYADRARKLHEARLDEIHGLLARYHFQ
jgi:predicted outer membrane protein